MLRGGFEIKVNKFPKCKFTYLNFESSERIILINPLKNIDYLSFYFSGTFLAITCVAQQEICHVPMLQR